MITTEGSKLMINVSRLICAIHLFGLAYVQSAYAEVDYRVLPKTMQVDYQNQNVTSMNALKIPRRVGPGGNLVLIDLGKRVEELDNAILDKKWNNALTRAQLEALIETRNLVVGELATGQEILTGSSGGDFPVKNKQQIDSYIAEILKGLSAPKGREYVRTKIEYGGLSTQKMALLFQSYAKEAAKSEDWSTYTPDQSLRVGTYVFEVKEINTKKLCKETVPVLGDPTERKICGAFKP
jgi:hypothetical protein